MAFRKYPFNVKFCGAAQIRKEDRLRVTFVMELCKENLMGSISRIRTTYLSSTPGAARDVIRWARDIANALEFIHSQGIVHRDFKLENIM